MALYDDPENQLYFRTIICTTRLKIWILDMTLGSMKTFLEVV